MTGKFAAVVTLLLAGFAPTSAAASGEKAPGDAGPLFEWSMPSLFGSARDDETRIVEPSPARKGGTTWAA